MSTTESSSGAQSPAGEPALKRAIGPKLLILFVIGDILGTGIYATMGNVAGKVGGALWLPFVIEWCDRQSIHVARPCSAAEHPCVGPWPGTALLSG